MKSIAEVMDGLPADFPYRHLLPKPRSSAQTQQERPESTGPKLAPERGACDNEMGCGAHGGETC